jgi:hypothetical protein
MVDNITIYLDDDIFNKKTVYWFEVILPGAYCLPDWSHKLVTTYDFYINEVIEVLTAMGGQVVSVNVVKFNGVEQATKLIEYIRSIKLMQRLR